MALQSINIYASITSTSNKTKAPFTPRKTAFLKVSDVDEERLISFGIRGYTTKNGDTFFCVKLADSIKLWNGAGRYKTLDTTVNAPNFKTTEDVMYPMSIIKGNKNNNDFYRLTAILCKDENIETIKETNPFA